MQDLFDLTTYIDQSTRASGVPLIVEDETVIASAASAVAARLSEAPQVASSRAESSEIAA